MAGSGKREDLARLGVWIQKGGFTPASFRWELALLEGIFERSIAEGGLGTAMNLLEQMEVWVSEERGAERRS
jgi:hypothetical protein